MLNYYRRTLIQLFSDVQRIYLKPWGHPSICLDVQIILIRRIFYIENRIRSLKELIREARRELSTKRVIPFTKKQSRTLKSNIKSYEQKIQEYRNLLFILRSIGDALAFTFVSRWDIKPMIFKETAGYISGKSGFIAEKQFLHYFFQQGHIAILNDITNSLRFGDLIVIGEDSQPGIVEIKLSNNQSARVDRQEQKAFELVDYLNTDHTQREGWSVTRRVLSAIFEDHVDEINHLLEVAVREGYAFGKIEEGLYYYTETSENKSDFASIIKNNLPNPPIAYFLNGIKYSCTGYFPFTLSIRDPEILFDFYQGNIIIIVLVDRDVITTKIRSQGLDVSFEQGNDWVLSIENPETVKRTGPLVLGRFLFDRIAFEFLSLDWILTETIYQAKNPPEVLFSNQI